VDTIEFYLTGSVGRLNGEGTEELSVTKHVPHFDAGEHSKQYSISLLSALNKPNQLYLCLSVV